MTRMKLEKMTTGWMIGVGFGLALQLGHAADAASTPKAELMEMTGGLRVKVAWLQGGDGGKLLKFYDSKTDKIIDLPLKDATPPLFTANGRQIVTHIGQKESAEVVLYDTETQQTKTLTKGLSNTPMAVWTDPKSKRTWVYVNSTGDKGEAWNEAAGGPIYRFPTDKPEARELFWDRTSSHFYLTFSADGTRACFEPSWANIGQLKLVFATDGKVDQDKSEYKTFGGGCFPGFAPDNSYRLFRLEGDHRGIAMCDANNTKQRRITTTDMLKGADAKGQTWLTAWSKNPRYLTCMAPDSDHAMIWLGRFDEDCKKIEKWVRISESGGPKCWNSQAWVAASAADNDGGPLIPMQAWTNSDGRKIQAAVQKVDGNKVTFRMADGRQIEYALDKLSAKSQKAIVDAGGAE
jgi:hypothetical protein